MRFRNTGVWELAPIPHERVVVTLDNDNAHTISARLTSPFGIRLTTGQRNAWNVRFRALNTHFNSRMIVRTCVSL